MPLPMNFNFSKLVYIGLKIAELVLAAIYLSLVSHHTTETQAGETYVAAHRSIISFIVITAGFMVPTFLLLVVQFHAPSAEAQRKSIFEMLYNIVAVIFHVAASSTVLSFTERFTRSWLADNFRRSGGIMGMINTGLYTSSAILAFIDYKRSD